MKKQNKVSTGIKGLDEIVYDGLPKGSISLIQGAPGTGKTTLGLQFLVEGATQFNESGIYITFEELPEQLYKDGASFGWNLKDLELNNKLRIICIQPDILLAQLTNTNGLIEQMINEIDCKRLVVDSISLYRALNNETAARNKVYTLRNILRKFGITTLFISESIGTGYPLDNHSFENYICDGVIHLTLGSYMDIYRGRTIEVLKMRGTKIMEGEHRFVFQDNGIHIIPALSMIEDKCIVSETTNIVSTGIPTLDDLLFGGLPRGSVFTINTNSRANLNYIIVSILAKRLTIGEKIITMLNNSYNIDAYKYAMQDYDVDLNEIIKDKRAFFVELLNRDMPDVMKDGIIHINDLSEAGFQKELREKYSKIMKSGENCFVYYDLNILENVLGKDLTPKFFAEEALQCRMNGITMVANCNFTELSKEAAIVYEGSSDGIIRTWIDGNYQMLQVTKSPFGRMSAPAVIENIDEKPYVRII